mgnify:CR=1 FL=1
MSYDILADIVRECDGKIAELQLIPRSSDPNYDGDIQALNVIQHIRNMAREPLVRATELRVQVLGVVDEDGPFESGWGARELTLQVPIHDVPAAFMGGLRDAMKDDSMGAWDFSRTFEEVLEVVKTDFVLRPDGSIAPEILGLCYLKELAAKELYLWLCLSEGPA